MLYKLSDWTITPGGRFIEDGPNSGEEFRECVLSRLLDMVKGTEEIITIDVSGTYGLPSGFTEESFGGLVRKYNKELVQKHFNFITSSNEEYDGDTERILSYIEEAE